MNKEELYKVHIFYMKYVVAWFRKSGKTDYTITLTFFLFLTWFIFRMFH